MALNNASSRDDQILLAMFHQAILANQNGVIREILDQIGFNQMSNRQIYQLVNELLETCIRGGNTEAGRLIINEVKETNPDEAKVSTLTRLFMMTFVEVETLKFATSLYPNVGHYSILSELITVPHASLAVWAADRLEAVYQPSNQSEDPSLITETVVMDLLELYQKALQVAIERENYDMTVYLTEKVQKLSPIAPKPTWVQNFVVTESNQQEEGNESNESPVPFNAAVNPFDYLPLKENNHEQKRGLDIEELSRLIFEGIESNSIAIDPTYQQQALEAIQRNLRAMEATQLQQVVTSVDKNLAESQYQRDLVPEDVNLFRLLGPVNVSYNAKLTTLDPSKFETVEELNRATLRIGKCLLFGGCRMLICTHREVDQEDDDDAVDEQTEENLYTDWFTGYCQICYRKIENRVYAIRRPLVDGGWQGCYCSFEHLWNDDIDVLEKSIINLFRQQLEQLGIQDRQFLNQNEMIIPRPTETQVINWLVAREEAALEEY